MNYDYRHDSEVDADYIHLKGGPYARTVKLREGLLLDLDDKGDVIGVEILNSISKRQ